ncbi:MAG TPA: D-alanyl-D-alanine carboxypeptidase/D-alanyl-D-alanine-endopeptidase [Intrasporangium sp.]|uniref:D-alanyl-D-alanine carboxypeptidase/D-alanyl-D-alanine endopeptidase n=1 Tax=Intrasporangium sp. TaxID=1925024 RepID=UPI002D79435D|nr:D-alanyl-D-alanine carboxypeptidase/D-alanyl-D-alanine-endopeptidase [Intrasporangium sp.]HET7399465.1 D-alanyl-D-alanine carboxypeptidase/D-alanyl-D-alanine-endopeptidase [Intrasporangium sp.]
MRRWVAGLGVAALAVGGYAALDVVDAAPGLLTTRPLPPPPPAETPGTRTLPVVAQPTLPTAPALPLPGLAGGVRAPTAAGVRSALEPVLRLPALADAALVVRDAQSGAPLLDRRGAERRMPASTTKLLSAAAVGSVLDADATMTTRVVQGGSADAVVLVAGGDSLLAPGRGIRDAVAGRAGLADLADQVAAALRARSVRSVRLSVDRSFAPGPVTAATWDPAFRPLGITGSVAMLGRSDQRATPGHPGPADPVAATQAAFAARLTERGIKVISLPGQVAAAPGAVLLGSVESAPVGEQLALAMTDSDNALTEVLARQAAFRSGAGTDFPATGRWVVTRVASLGIDTTGADLRDASGLSRENRVTARLLADILVRGHDGSSPVLRAALDGLPVAGLTGTLAGRFGAGPEGAAAGRARAKTGTLTGATGLAGSVVDDSGRLLVFAGLVGRAGTYEARAALDRLVAVLASCGCR